jgi:hypothetical protein
LCYWANIGPRPRCYRTTARKLSRPSQPGGPVPLWAPGYQRGHGRACERTPRRLPSGRRLKSGESEVLGRGGSGHRGHRRRGGPIGGNREGNDSPQWRLHGDARRVVRSVGEGPEEWLRLELELSVSSMGTRQSSWHGRPGRGTTGGVGSTVRCSHGGGGWCWLCFGEFLRGRLGGRQLDARALLEEVRPELRGGCSDGGRGGPRHGTRAAVERWHEAEEQSRMGVGSEWRNLVSPRCESRDKGGRGWSAAHMEVVLHGRRVGVGGRWRSSVGARGERGDEATRALG